MAVLRWVEDRIAPVAPTLGGPLIVAGVLLLLGAVLAAAASWNVQRARIQAEGVVVENIATFAHGGGVVYSPRLRFRTPQGLQEVLAADPADDPEFAPGEQVPVSYPPGKPQLAVIATAWRVYKWAIVLALLGIAVTDAGLLLRSVIRRQAARSLRASAR